MFDEDPPRNGTERRHCPTCAVSWTRKVDDLAAAYCWNGCGNVGLEGPLPARSVPFTADREAHTGFRNIELPEHLRIALDGSGAA